MKAIAFKSKIKNIQIQIPKKAQSELTTIKDKDVRVIVVIDDTEIYDNIVFQESAKEQFLKGYADSDSVYNKTSHGKILVWRYCTLRLIPLHANFHLWDLNLLSRSCFPKNTFQ